MFRTLIIVLSATLGLTFSTMSLAEGHSHVAKEAHHEPAAQKVSHGHGKSLHQQWCVRCHGSVEGEGLLGPNLSKSVETLSKEEFVNIVTHGKKTDTAFMPAWKSNPRVMNGMDKIYAFLLHASQAEQ